MGTTTESMGRQVQEEIRGIELWEEDTLKSSELEKWSKVIVVRKEENSANPV